MNGTTNEVEKNTKLDEWKSLENLSRSNHNKMALRSKNCDEVAVLMIQLLLKNWINHRWESRFEIDVCYIYKQSKLTGPKIAI